ncbi:MAG: YdbL family protein [Victivallales bacterium]|nr:YdbL family protein [Victivallales bacterium]
MKWRRMFNLMAVALTLGFMVSASCVVFASPSDDIRTRMKERLPKLNKLKDAGVIGEDNKGFIAIRDKSADTGNVVGAENTDRKAVYVAIARKNGASPETVGQRRAIKIAETGKSHHWFQNAAGKWYQKP